MALWSDGYFTDIEYIDGYYLELNPLWINFNLTLAGFDIPTNAAGGGANICPKDFNYLELAFGKGSSIVAHAAVTNGYYIGTDFNPTQVRMANEYAIMDNVTLYEDSFKELLERFCRTGVQFDYICFHGIFSWISEENRKFILEIIRRFLKVGGAVYNSYNCAPGWNPKMPTRELLKLHSDLYHSPQDNVESRVKNGIQFLKDFLAINPGFALASPLNKSLIESFNEKSYVYIAHEYFNANWDCFYFYQVAKLMEEAKCDFAASANVLEHMDVFSLTKEMQEFLNKVQDRIFKEQLKDYCRNTQFRKDIFLKGAHKIAPQQREERLLNTPFALLASIEDCDYKVQCLLGEANLTKESHEKVLKALEKDSYKPKTLQEIMHLCKTNFSEILSLLIPLIQKRMVAPAQFVDESLAARAKAYNANLLERNLRYDTPNFIAAPVIASAISCNNVDKIILYAYCNGVKKESELCAFVFKTLKQKGQGILKEGKPLVNDAENKEAIKPIVKEFLEKRLLIAKTIGIV